MPPCPYAQKAIIDGRVEFVELNATADWTTIYQLISNTDFDEKDVLCVIVDPRRFSLEEAESIAETLNERYMPRDIVVLEDHPDMNSRVKDVKLNNGHYTLFLVQRLSKLNRLSRALESTNYYKNWSKGYLESVKGFRDRAETES
tara:strand:+ start:157 stop:591 length:435 start_codon:yes stop_codon:yes gene_type:complete